MRTAFVKTLLELARKDKRVWLLTGDLGYSVLENFGAAFPERYLNVGVAEQNMIGIATGLALSGKCVFAYSIVPFVTLRCLEQVRNDVCLENANVKLIGVGGGFSYGQLGPTHHSIEDIAVMRSLPNMTVVCPGDPWEVEEATKAMFRIKTPIYLRLGKAGEPRLSKKRSEFIIGRGVILKDGDDLTIISTGNMLETALEVCKMLDEQKISARIISMHTVKPLDEKLVLESAKKTGSIFTLEEHSVIGGLGSAVSRTLMESDIKCRFHSFGVEDRFTKMAGTQQYLRMVNGLSVDEIVKKIIKKIKND